MAEFLDNPAGRLQRWVERFQALPNKEKAISEALAEMLDVDHSTVHGRVEAFRVAMRLAGLAEEVRAGAALLPEHADADMLLEDFSQFEGFFDQMTMARQVRVQDMLAQVDAAGFRSVGLLSRQFHRYRPEPTLDDGVRVTLIMSVVKLRADVAGDTTLDAEVRDFILARFADIERALRDASMTGAGAVEAATDAIIGSIQRQPKMWQRIAESVFAGTVSSVIAGLFLAVANPPVPAALPPGAPETVVQVYTQACQQVIEDGVTPEVVQGVVVSDDESAKSLSPASDKGDVKDSPDN